MIGWKVLTPQVRAKIDLDGPAGVYYYGGPA